MGHLLRSYILGLLGLFLVVNVGAEYRYIHIWNEDYSKNVECREIQCEKGQFAKLCTPHDRDSSRCVPCEEGYYQDDNVNPLGKKCKLKRLCLDQNPDVRKCTTVKDPGSLTKDATCSCLQGCTWHETLGECMPDPNERPTTPRLPCPPGQTGCFPACPEGFFKDGDSCKEHTNCRREGKCVEIEGNATADNICSAANFTDYTTDCNQTSSSQQQKSEGPKMLTIILVVTVPVGVISPLVIIVCCVKKRRDKKRTTNKMNDEQNRQEILTRLSNKEDLEREALLKAFGIVENNIGENWERLGRHLLENFDTKRYEIYEEYPIVSATHADRVHRMLTTWKQKRANDATVAALLQALDDIGQGNISNIILKVAEGLLSEADSTTVMVENRDGAVHSSLPDVHVTARRRDHRQDNLPPPPCKSVSVNEINQGKQQRSIIQAAASSGIGLSSSDAIATSVPNVAQIQMQRSHQRAGSDGSVTSRDSLLGESKDTVDMAKETRV